MAVGDKLNDILAPTHVQSATPRWSTDKRTWPNGRTTTRRRWAAPQRAFEVSWVGISLAEWNALETHFADHSGGYAAFPFTDPHSGETYTVRYADDELDREMLANTRGLYRVRATLEEDKA